MKNIWNVLSFEYKGFVGAKSFKIVTIIFVVAIIAATSIPQIAGLIESAGGGEIGKKDAAAIIRVGDALTNDVFKNALSPAAMGDVGSAIWVDLSDNPPSDRELAKAIEDGDYIFVVRYAGGTEFEIFVTGARITAYEGIASIAEYITDAAKEAEIAALPAAERETVIRISSLAVEPKVTDIGGNAANNFIMGYVLIMFMMYAIVGYSNYVATSVVTEKTSKAMELLITAVRPLHLMVGKVLGVGFAALTQIGAIIAALLVGTAINMRYWITTDNILAGITQGGNVEASLAIVVLAYFLLGFFLYAFLTAALASTVTKPEEAATVVTFPMVLIMAGLLFGFLTLFGVLSKTAAAILSYIPFFTPINMMARYTLGDAGMRQLAIGAAIMAAAIVVVAFIAAKIFRVGVMLYGVKATPKQLMKAIRNA